MLLPRILREDGENTLRLVNNEQAIGLARGGRMISGTNDCGYLAKIFARIDADEWPPGTKIAHLGGGMGWLPKMLLGYGFQQDIYEIDQDISQFLFNGILSRGNVKCIVGDWKKRLAIGYDIIVYDIDEPLLLDLKPALNPGGKIYTLID